MQLHPFVYFVGDSPSDKNVRPEVPFVGTKSYSTLLLWIARMDLDVEFLSINNAFAKDKSPNYLAHMKGHKVVALGSRAHKRLQSENIDHFILPHPSGLNRTLNNKKYLIETLKSCKSYIYG